jgi:transglutaminase-like putative cysteine protease
LWPGQPDTYSESPKWFAPIESGVSEQDAALNGVLLKSASPYTLGLFSSGFDTSAARLDLTRLAARVTFTAET